ncbi:hypothetical protein D3C87_1890620 [compost metagenome]
MTIQCFQSKIPMFVVLSEWRVIAVNLESRQFEGQLTHRLTSKARDSICKSRGQRWQSWFPHPCGWFCAGYYVNGKFGHVGDAWNAEVSKITLLHDTIFQGNGTAWQAHR